MWAEFCDIYVEDKMNKWLEDDKEDGVQMKSIIIYKGKFFDVIKKSDKRFEIQHSIWKNVVSPTNTELEAINKVKAMDWAFEQGYNKGFSDYEEFGDDKYDD